MMLSSVTQGLGLLPVVKVSGDREVTGGYCSDLLSDVLKNAKPGNVWVTNQKHQNCVAVAALLDLSAVIIAGGVCPDDNTIEKADAEGVPLYTSKESAFDVVGRLYALGITGEGC